MAHAARQEFNVEGWLHLDHAASPGLIERALDAGFDSVMIDASDKPLPENIKVTRMIVKLAEQYGASVEAELGYVAKLGEPQDRRDLTTPAEAKRFAEDTGVSALAIGIGSAHGFYHGDPVIDLERLSDIRASTSVPLVLHGGSGISENVIREAVYRGICKINIATETKHTFMTTVKTVLSETDEIDIRKVFPPAISAVKELMMSKFIIIPKEKNT
jgi:fructose-bisphosphate aldolase class II/tagatose 1,6-diphosphate aldolase GatY/KbaY